MLSHIQTTWNQLSTDVRRSPFLSRKELRFHKAEEMQHIPFIPSDSHSGFYFPPFANANGFETTDCLECLQILNILYMAGGSALKLEIGYCVP